MTIDLSQYRANAQGHLVPINTIPPLDLQRDELVTDIVKKVEDLRAAMTALKVEIDHDIQAHMQLSAEQYAIELGGELGNLTLSSIDGQCAVKVAIDRPIFFDEKIHAAKVLIDECLNEWSGDNANMKALVKNVFRVNEAGNLDAKQVLTLQHHHIDDDRWKRAMAIINDSIQRTRTKRYIRFYRRQGAEKKLTQISLNFTAIDIDGD